VVGVAEVGEDGFGNFHAYAGDDGLVGDAALLADPRDQEVGALGRLERIHRFEMSGEVLGGLHADVRDPERVDRPPELALLRLGEPGQHVVDGLLLEPFEHHPFAAVELEHVDRGVDELQVHELFGHGVAEPVDVEALLAREVHQAPDLHVAGRRAELVGGLLAVAGGVKAELLEAGFEIERLGVRGALRRHDAEHLRDDLAGLLDADGVAFADVLAGDLGGVVERRARDGRAGQQHGVELGDGRDHARAADLHADGAEHGLGLVGRELERHRPVRELARRARPALVLEPVDLHHGAIGREGQAAAEDVELLDGLPGGLDAPLDIEVVADGEAPVLQLRLELLERGEGAGWFAGAEAVADDAEASLAGFLAVEQLHRTGGEVARVGVERFARGLAFGVEPLELRQLHVDLAAHLEEVGRVRQRARDLADERHVGRDVVTPRTVAPGDRAHEATPLIGQRNRDPVDLGFDDELQPLSAEGLIETLPEGPEVGLVVGVVERQHRRPVVGLLEALGLVVADAEVGPGEFGMRPFQVG